MAPRTLVWMADATLATATLPTLWANSPNGGGSCTLERITSGTQRMADKTGALANGSGSKTFTAASTVLACAAGNLTAGTATNQWQILFYGDAGATQHITVMFDGSGHLQVRRGTSSGTVIATGTTVIPHSTWFQIQVEVTIGDAAGTVRIRLNGSASYEIDFTGDTKNAGTATTIDRVLWFTSGGYPMDDIALFTGTGDWPGDVRVYCALPSGNGATSQGVGSDGNSTDNYLLVDERPDSSADYVGITTDGNRDLVAVADLPSGITSVLGVATIVTAAKSDAGSKSVKVARRSGGTDYVEASAHALSTTYQAWSVIDQNDPDTAAAWSAAAFNALQIGAEAAT